MLAGFLSALGGRAARLTCCVPRPAAPLARRFPGIDWLPYDDSTRRACIENCDAWLGLGGSPWQAAVSSWFADHIAAELRFCEAARKPMYFLGVGVQDRAGLANPELRAAAKRAQAIWTRDAASAAALAGAGGAGRVRAAADLAHAFFEVHPPPAACAGRLTAVLNFDYAGWPAMGAALAALDRLPARDRVWLAQEDRALPGAERELFKDLPERDRLRWSLRPADDSDPDLARVLGRWPSGEWLLTSRYHAALAGAWAGSRAVVIATNDKLRGGADELGYPALGPAADPAGLDTLLRSATPPMRSILNARAAAARRACGEFFDFVGL
jgi:polysaccharide pyruvyl transferase WcaK-like protein